MEAPNDMMEYQSLPEVQPETQLQPLPQPQRQFLDFAPEPQPEADSSGNRRGRGPTVITWGQPARTNTAAPRRQKSNKARMVRADQAEPKGSFRGHHDASGHSDRLPLPRSRAVEGLDTVPHFIFLQRLDSSSNCNFAQTEKLNAHSSPTFLSIFHTELYRYIVNNNTHAKCLVLVKHVKVWAAKCPVSSTVDCVLHSFRHLRTWKKPETMC